MSDDKLTLLGHLRELRRRLTRSVIAVGITTILAFLFADHIFRVLTMPIRGVSLIFVEMTEMFSTYMTVSLVSGIAMAMPYLVYEFIMFVSPALTPREKKYVYIVLPWIGIMFLGGVAFGFFVLLPPAIGFLVSFGNDIATPQIRIGNYISLVTRLLLAIGLIFEFPVISTLLARLGVINSRWLAGKRKLAIVLAFVVGAAVTPTPDPVNQTLVSLPLIVLYELSIWLAKIFQKRAPRSVPEKAPIAPQE